MQNPWDIDKKNFPKNESIEKQIQFLLGYAILAPSTHNSQPWLFKIKKNTCEIYNNRNIVIFEADRKKRDLYISFGTCIENLITAAKYFDMFESVAYSTSHNNMLIATLTFTKPKSHNNKYEQMLNAIPKRINARGFFLDKSIEPSLLNNIRGQLNIPNSIQIDFVSSKEKINELATLTANGIRVAYNNKHFRKEMAQWMNSSYSKKREGLHGYSLRIPKVLSLVFPRLVPYIDVGKSIAKKNYDSISSAPLVCVFSSKDESFETWLNIGRIAQSLSLHFVKNEIYTSVFVASIEMGFALSVQHVLENSDSWQPQFMYCAGYMNNIQPHSKRYIVEEKLL